MKNSVIKKIPGTWILQTMTVEFANGNIHNMFGETPVGISIFDSKGYMSAQMGSSTRMPFKNEALNQGTSAEIADAFNNYMAFFGQYNETSPGTLIIDIEGCQFPNWEGKQIIRYAEITDNLLLLTTPPTKIGPDDAIVKAVWRKY